MLEFDNGIKAIVMNLEEDNVGAVLLGPTPTESRKAFIVKTYQAHRLYPCGRRYAGTCYRPVGENRSTEKG